MKQIFLIACLLLCAIQLQAQTLYTSASASIYISGAANIDGMESTSPTLYVSGTVQNNGTLTNAGEMQITGSFDNPGTFASTGDNTFKGGATQNLSGSFTGAESFYNVIVNKSVNPVVLSTEVAVSNQVNLVNGKISIGSSNLTLAPAASLIGYDANDYIFTSATGTLRQTVGASNVIFPVGITSYNPITLNNAGTSDVFSVRVANSVVCQGVNTLSTTAKVNRMWYISESVAGGSDASITPQWNTSDEQAGFARATSGLIPLNGTNFDLSSATNTAATSVSANVWSQTKSNQTTISPVIVTSLAPLSPTSPASFCNGGTLNLIAPSDVDFSYIWSESGNAIVPSASASTYTANANGVYSVDITSAGGCKLASPTITATQLPVPSAPTITSTAGTSGLSICAGTSLTLTGSPAAEYAWFKNGTFVKYEVAPNASYSPTVSGGTNNYSLVVIYSGVCPSSASANFTVIGDEPVSVITASGPTSFCGITNAPILNATPPSGTGYTYSWIGTSPSAASTTSATFTPTNSGNHRAIVTNSNGCSKSSPWVGIVIMSVPAAYAGVDKTVCAGSSTTIGAASSTGVSYLWTPSTNLSSPTLANPILTPAISGMSTYVLTATNNSSGCSKKDTVNIMTEAIPATPTLSGTSSPVCEGNTITLSPSGVTGATNWYKNSTFLTTTASPTTRTISTATVAADSYTIRAKSSTPAACLSLPSNPVSVNILPAPIPTITSTPADVAGIITLCTLGASTRTVALNTSIPSGAPAIINYNWQQYLSGTPTNLVPAATANTYNAVVSISPATQNNKVFRVQANYANGCLRASANRTVKLLNVGCTPNRIAAESELITEFNLLSVFPNPTEGKLNITLTNCPSTEGIFTLYNALGQLIYEQKVSITNGEAQQEWDISSVVSGVYTLSFQTEKQRRMQKVVKE